MEQEQAPTRSGEEIQRALHDAIPGLAASYDRQVPTDRRGSELDG